MRNIQFLIAIFFLSLFTQSNFTAQSMKKCYETAEGKIVGIWPHNDRFKSVDMMKELKERWGFNYILLAEIYGVKEKIFASDAGFDSLHLMHQIILPNSDSQKERLYERISQLGKVWAYYFDEPISREQSYIQFLHFVTDLSNRGFYPYAKFIVSELDEKKANPVFVEIFLRSETGIAQLNRFAKGTAMKSISIQDLKMIKIPNIPRKKQDFIAEEYKNLCDELIILQRQIDLIHDRKARLLEEVI